MICASLSVLATDHKVPDFILSFTCLACERISSKVWLSIRSRFLNIIPIRWLRERYFLFLSRKSQYNTLNGQAFLPVFLIIVAATFTIIRHFVNVIGAGGIGFWDSWSAKMVTSSVLWSKAGSNGNGLLKYFQYFGLCFWTSFYAWFFNCRWRYCRFFLIA